MKIKNFYIFRNVVHFTSLFTNNFSFIEQTHYNMQKQTFRFFSHILNVERHLKKKSHGFFFFVSSIIVETDSISRIYFIRYIVSLSVTAGERNIFDSETWIRMFLLFRNSTILLDNSNSESGKWFCFYYYKLSYFLFFPNTVNWLLDIFISIIVRNGINSMNNNNPTNFVRNW